jgi:hypothetical protein
MNKGMSPGRAKGIGLKGLSPFQGSVMSSHYPGFALLTPGYFLSPLRGQKQKVNGIRRLAGWTALNSLKRKMNAAGMKQGNFQKRIH